MLQRVGMGQVRFNIPGLAPDSRGVVVGRQAVLRFSAMDRLVSFLRLWSGEQVLDDLHPGLRIVQVRNPGGAREALLLFSVASVALVDAAARATRTVGGQCFTGAGKHFVQYRDARAPLGYDASSLEIVGDPTDFVLYGVDHTLHYSMLGELPLDKLLLRLDLQRVQGGAPARGDSLLLTVRRGLGPLVIAYLHRAEAMSAALRVSAAFCEPPVEGHFQRGSAFWILRLENVPARLLAVLSGTPGLSVLVPLADNVAVALGYRHPIHLGSCKHVFPGDRLYLFRPNPAGVMVVNPAPVFSPVADLVRLAPVDRTPTTADQPAPTEGSGAQPSSRPPLWTTTAVDTDRIQLAVPLRLEAAPAGVGRVVGSIIPWERIGWLRSLCYALPPRALRGYRLAMLDRGLLVVAPDVLDGFPFGQLLHAPAPGLLVPLGWELRPAVSPNELAARVGATAGAIVVFPGPGEPPFFVAAASMQTLEARVLAEPSLDSLSPSREVDPASAMGDDPSDIEVENQPLGPMPLWGFGR